MQTKELRILLVGGDQETYELVNNRLDSLHSPLAPVLWCNDYTLALGLIDISDYDLDELVAGEYLASHLALGSLALAIFACFAAAFSAFFAACAL